MAETPDGMPVLGQATSICGFAVPLATHLTALLRRFGGDIGRGLAARDTKTCSTSYILPLTSYKEKISNRYPDCNRLDQVK
jgi:hypothetical protein